MLTTLDKAVAGSGLAVTKSAGWKTRGAKASAPRPSAIVVHHTATSSKSKGDYPTLNTIRNGRAGLPGPLSQLGLGRSGRVYIVAAGSANHNHPAIPVKFGNAYAIGIECEHSGTGKWPAVQYDALVRLVAALCVHYKLDPATDVRGHKEATTKGRKVDPNFNMDAFRRAVAAEVAKRKGPKVEKLSPRQRFVVTAEAADARRKPTAARGSNITSRKAKGSTFYARARTVDPASGIAFLQADTAAGRWFRRNQLKRLS